MMKKIAVVCAYPAGLNPGMLSVDLAFQSLIGNAELDLEVAYFCFEQAFSLTGVFGSLHYHHLVHHDQLMKYDKIIYWGDFLHWIEYFNRDIVSRYLKNADSRSHEELKNKWYELFLLESADDEFLSEVIVFGGTLYGLTAQQLADARYKNALVRLYENAEEVLMRDQASSNFVGQLARPGSNAFGCDCALFLSFESLGTSAEMGGSRGDYIVCSFGRSGASRALLSLASQIAALAKKRLVILPWLGEPRGVNALGDKLRVIRGAYFSITDIYHMAVSSWREGTPVLGIGKAASVASDTLSDKKKEIFFRQIFASDYYLYLEDILGALASDKKMIEYSAQALIKIQEENALNFIFDAVRRQKENAYSRLISRLT